MRQEGGAGKDPERAMPPVADAPDLAGQEQPVVVIEETTDLAPLHAFVVANELDESELPEGRQVVAWAARTGRGRLIGAILLEYGPELPVIHWLAVEEAWRGRKVATRLLSQLEGEARRRGVTRLWTTARAPGFFFANGFDEAPEGAEARLLLGDCLTCRQYRRGCEPKAMMKDLGPAGGAAEPPGPAVEGEV